MHSQDPAPLGPAPRPAGPLVKVGPEAPAHGSVNFRNFQREPLENLPKIALLFLFALSFFGSKREENITPTKVPRGTSAHTMDLEERESCM